MPHILVRVQTHEIMKLHNSLVSSPDKKKQIRIKGIRTNSTIIYMLAIKTGKLSLLHRSKIFIANFKQASNIVLHSPRNI